MNKTFVKKALVKLVKQIGVLIVNDLTKKQYDGYLKKLRKTVSKATF